MGWCRTPRLRLALMLSAAALAPAVAARAAPTAVTENGRIAGQAAGTIDEFLGIRYAAPPTGEGRWQPPQPMPQALFSSTATSFGPNCAQSPSAFGRASTSEDCLYLNVYAPSASRRVAAEPLPVMVWIHGGAFVTGESDDYDPTRLVDTGNVIVVTINYRLGFLGFLAESGLDAEGHVAADYGLQDQQFALDWVKRNIAGFGGDASRVTIFGESAGGLSVLANLASPTAYGLFSRAIVESGAYALSLPTLAAAEAAGDALASALGCAVGDTACLRAVPVSAILAQQANVALSVTPIVDGTTLPRSVNTAFKTGQFIRVPLLNGSNHDEGRLFVPLQAGLTADQYPAALAQAYGTDLAPAVAAKYPLANYPQPVLALATATGDSVFSCTARQVDRWAARHVPVYAYEFNDENAPEYSLPPTTFPFGATHATELQFLFGLPELPGTPALTAEQVRLSDTMVRYWTNFASTASPNQAALPFWAPYARQAEVFQSLEPPTPAPEVGFAKDHKCSFWQPVINPPSAAGMASASNAGQ